MSDVVYRIHRKDDCYCCEKSFPLKELTSTIERGSVQLVCFPCAGNIHTMRDPAWNEKARAKTPRRAAIAKTH